MTVLYHHYCMVTLHFTQFGHFGKSGHVERHRILFFSLCERGLVFALTSQRSALCAPFTFVFFFLFFFPFSAVLGS